MKRQKNKEELSPQEEIELIALGDNEKIIAYLQKHRLNWTTFQFLLKKENYRMAKKFFTQTSCEFDDGVLKELICTKRPPLVRVCFDKRRLNAALQLILAQTKNRLLIREYETRWGFDGIMARNYLQEEGLLMH